MEALATIVIVATVFFGIYSLIKVYTDYLLKRRIVRSGHTDKAGILDPPAMPSAETNRYPSLKWGLVALLAGLGLILIEVLRNNGTIDFTAGEDTFLPFGIELVAISLGFLIYFLIVNAKGLKKQ